MHNTVSGSKADVSEYADLLEELLASADTEEERNRIAPNLEAYPTTEAYLRACNPHTAEPGRIRQPANFIQYLDVNSLYGTAGDLWVGRDPPGSALAGGGPPRARAPT